MNIVNSNLSMHPPCKHAAADKAKFLLQRLGCCIRYIHIAISRMPFLYAFIDQEFLHFLSQLPSSVLREYLKHTHGTFRVETCKTSEAPVLDYLPYLLCLYAFMYVIKSIMIVLCSFLSMLFCKRRYQATLRFGSSKIRNFNNDWDGSFRIVR